MQLQTTHCSIDHYMYIVHVMMYLLLSPQKDTLQLHVEYIIFIINIGYIHCTCRKKFWTGFKENQLGTIASLWKNAYTNVCVTVLWMNVGILSHTGYNTFLTYILNAKQVIPLCRYFGESNFKNSSIICRI